MCLAFCERLEIRLAKGLYTHSSTGCVIFVSKRWAVRSNSCPSSSSSTCRVG